jgi:hypothetical protein
MNTSSIRNSLHSINLKKQTKPTAICLTAIFVLSMRSVFVAAPVQAATTTPALHTSGSYILDANGNTVYLRGMGIADGHNLIAGTKQAITGGFNGTIIPPP